MAATFSDSITYSSTSSGTAVAGTVRNADGTEKKDGDNKPIPTSPEDLTDDKGFAGQYDGPTDFMADYTIVLDDKNMLDLTKSKVIFTTINYTARNYNRRTEKYGKPSLVRSNFKTPEIQITDIKFIDNDPKKGVESFNFKSNIWYPKTEPQGNSLINNDLAGTINLKDGKSSYTASFIRIPTGSVYTYKVDGMKKANDPFPPPGEDPREPFVFSPGTAAIPEPLTLLGSLTAVGFGITFKRKSFKQTKQIQRRTYLNIYLKLVDI